MEESNSKKNAVKHEIEWESVESNSKVTRFGGSPFLISDAATSHILDSWPPAYVSNDSGNTILDAWPHYADAPLPFFGQIVLDNQDIAYLFLDDTVEGSWQAEDGANAVIIYPSATEIAWLEYKPVDADSAPLYSKDAYAPLSDLTEPVWLQGDETPEGYNFKLQIPSQIDPEGNVNIGDGYGDAYIFISEDNTSGRIVWQS